MIERELGQRLSDVVSATPWLVVSDIDQSSVALAMMLTALGATDVLAVGISPGTGAIDDSVPLITLGETVSGSTMAGIRNGQRRAEDLPPDVIDRIDAWDPGRRARVLVPFTFHAGRIAGRPTWGARPSAWEELEDKLVAEQLWSAADVPHEAAVVADLDDPSGLGAAYRTVAQTHGAVFAGDAEAGWHGGASSVRWVTGEDRIDSVAADLATDHRRVRVMPYLDGVPCSIHGMVVGTGVAAFRPCEMIVLRDRDAGRFEYAGVGTYWDPSPAVRDEMRAVARRVGAMLKERVGYRGAFTVDGVVTGGGFRPTELNARFGAGMTAVGRSRPDVPLFAVNCAVVAGDIDDLDAATLEEWTVTAADECRAARSLFSAPSAPVGGGEVTQSYAIGAVRPDGTIEIAPVGDDIDDVVVVARWGAGSTGGVVLVEYRDGVPVGPPTALIAEQVAHDISERWGLDLGRLEAATWSSSAS